MILVTGATGTIGSEVVKRLVEMNIPVRALVRDVHKAALPQGVTIAQGDFLHPDTLEQALQGVERAFLVSANDPRQVEMEANFIAAAQQMRVQHIVKLSVMGADVNSPSTFQRWHGEIQQRLEDSGIRWTHLQPNMLMQNVMWFASAIALTNSFPLTVGDTKISLIDARDVAAVAAVCLTESGHENKSYVLTGFEALTFTEVAQKLSQALGKPVTFVNVTPQKFKQGAIAAGEPEWYVDADLELFALWATGVGTPVTNAVALTKRSPRSFDEFALDLAKSERAAAFYHNGQSVAKTVEHVVGGLIFGEGPVYDSHSGYLLFCDTQADVIYKLLPNDTLEVFRRPAGMPSGLAFDSQGRLVVCENRDRRVTRTEKDGTIVTLVDRFAGKRLNSPNDLVIRSDGTIYFSDPPYGLPEMTQGKELEFNGVYKISPNGELSLLIKDLELPNGLVFSLDERLLYINDTSARTIHCFDVNADGTLGSDRIFARMTGDPSDWGADGMTIDTEGNIYCAGPQGVWVFAANGELQARIYPPEIITNLTWGDGDLKTLYMTGFTSLYRMHC